MERKTERPFGGIVEPIVVRKPLLVRACTALYGYQD
jgi:hypothetical protein